MNIPLTIVCLFALVCSCLGLVSGISHLTTQSTPTFVASIVSTVGHSVFIFIILKALYYQEMMRRKDRS